MTAIHEIKSKDGDSLFIEVEDVEISNIDSEQKSQYGDDLQNCSAKEFTKDTLEVLKKTLKNVTEIVSDGLGDISPDEFSIELNIGFKGKSSPIPVILSGEASSSIKVNAKWVNKKGD